MSKSKGDKVRYSGFGDKEEKRASRRNRTLRQQFFEEEDNDGYELVDQVVEDDEELVEVQVAHG